VQSPATAERAGGRSTIAAVLIKYYKQGIGLLILAVLGLGGFFLVRRLHKSPNRAVARAAAGGRKKQAGEVPARKEANPSPKPAKYRPRRESPYTDAYEAPRKIEYGSPLMLKLYVADQNTFIGKRNTHLVKPGLSYTVGGGRSDFLIFLVRVPPHIGELRYANSSCSFHPRKPEYFPDIGAEPVQDCIGKTIRIISDKGYELFIRIEQYEDPLVELNRIMHSIKVPSALEV
jgi:hypothetical protein